MNNNRLSTIEKTVDIIQYLEASGPTRLGVIAGELKMNSSTVHHHLSTLEHAGLVTSVDGTYTVTRSRTAERHSIYSLDLFDLLSDGEEHLVDAIADQLDLDQPSVARMVTNYEQRGYVTETDDGAYRIGLRFLELGGFRRNQMPIYRMGKERIDMLATETGELANLVIEENGLGVYLYQAMGEGSANLDTYVGKRTPLHQTAFGKAILSQMPRERILAIVDRHGLSSATDNTITEVESLFERLETIRERGFAYDDEERLQGLRCVAAPVTDETDTVIGAVSVAAPVSRMREDRYHDTLPERVLSTVNLIELDVNYA